MKGDATFVLQIEDHTLAVSLLLYKGSLIDRNVQNPAHDSNYCFDTHEI